jgi:hypothetical protein
MQQKACCDHITEKEKIVLFHVQLTHQNRCINTGHISIVSGDTMANRRYHSIIANGIETIPDLSLVLCQFRIYNTTISLLILPQTYEVMSKILQHVNRQQIQATRSDQIILESPKKKLVA